MSVKPITCFDFCTLYQMPTPNLDRMDRQFSQLVELSKLCGHYSDDFVKDIENVVVGASMKSVEKSVEESIEESIEESAESKTLDEIRKMLHGRLQNLRDQRKKKY